MRFGLVGTGPWAQMTHGPGLVAAAQVDLVGVWGRSRERTGPLARELGATAYDDHEAMLADVDAVAFSVPPDAQVPMALAAARAGKHLLLEKPVALDVDSALELASAVEAGDLSSVVFFTDRFTPAVRGWLEQVSAAGGWKGGWLRWFSALQLPDNPFGKSQWRWERGALWDVGPHALSTLTAALGPVASVTAVAGAGDLVTLALHHESGALSTATLSQFVPAAAASFEAAVWGVAGVSSMPPRRAASSAAELTTAAEELVASAHSGRKHQLDVRFGARVVGLLAEAQRQLDER